MKKWENGEIRKNGEMERNEEIGKMEKWRNGENEWMDR
jgi:hypothetical protein